MQANIIDIKHYQEDQNQETSFRSQVQQRLTEAITVTEDPATVFCIEPFSSIARDGGEQLVKLLTRVLQKPDQAAIVVADQALVFAFKNQLPHKDSNLSRIQETLELQAEEV